MSSCTTNLSNGKKRRKISWFWGLMKNLVIIWVKSRQLTFWWLHTIVTWRSMSLLGHFLPTFAKIFDWITYSNGWSKTEARLSTKIPTCPTHAKWRAADGGPKYHWKNWKMIDEILQISVPFRMNRLSGQFRTLSISTAVSRRHPNKCMLGAPPKLRPPKYYIGHKEKGTGIFYRLFTYTFQVHYSVSMARSAI